MSTVNIQISVTGRIGSKSFSWSRIATVVEIEDVMDQTAESLSDKAGFSSTENAGDMIDGWHSFNGLAVAAFVNSAPSTVLTVVPRDAVKSALGPALLPANIPYIVYNGAGTGYDGGASASNTSTDQPTEDIESVGFEEFIGRPSVGSFVALKTVS